MTMNRQVRSLGQTLTDQAVGIFIAASLPATGPVGKVHLNAGSHCQLVVPTHFFALVIGQRFAQRGLRYTIQHLSQCLQHVG